MIDQFRYCWKTAFFIIVCIFCKNDFILSQNIIAENASSQGQSWLKKANQYDLENNIPLLIQSYEKAQIAFTIENDTLNYLETTAKLGRLHHKMWNATEAISVINQAIVDYGPYVQGKDELGNLYAEGANAYMLISEVDSSKAYLTKAISIFESNQSFDLLGNAKIIQGDLAWDTNIGDPLDYYQQAKEIYAQALPENDIRHGYPIYRLGAFSNFKGNITDGAKYLNEAKNIFEEGDDEMMMSSILRHQALLDRENKDYSSGLEKCTKAVEYIIKRFGPDHFAMSYAYNVAGNLHFSAGNIEKAEAEFRKAYEVRMKAMGPTHHETVSMLMNVGVMQEKQYAYEKALNTYTEVLQKMEANPFKSYDYFKIFRNIGLVYEYMQDTAKAMEQYAIAIEKGPLVLAPDAKEWIDVYMDQAYLSKTPEQALQFMDEAFKILIKDKPNTLALDEEDFGKVAHPLHLFRVISSQTFFTQKRYAKSGKESDFLKALELSKAGLRLIDYLRIHLKSDNSRSNFYRMSKYHFEDALTTGSSIRAKGININYLDEWIFDLMERSKAWGVLEMLSDKKSTALASIPADEMAKERALNLNIDRLYQSLSQLDESQSDDISSIRRNIYDLKNELANLQLSIKQKYPEYEIISDQVDRANILDIQQWIRGQEDSNKKKGFLHYTVTYDAIYAMLIDADRHQFYQLETDEDFSDQVVQLHSWLKNKNQDKQIYKDLANSLSEQLIYPLIGELKDMESLVIVPDGVLHYLPFEILNTQKDGDYLIESMDISYAHSGSILLELENQESQSGTNLLAFAPEFSGNGLMAEAITRNGDTLQSLSNDIVRGDLTPLNGASKEVANIQKYLKGKSFIGSVATESAFKKNGMKSGILHFATHAIIDDEEPMNSYLALATETDSDEDGALYTYELQHMELNAQMAVLSACNTGYGKLEDGEGMMSLGRTFILAGCQSVVMSYWPAQDQSTATIMDAFYQKLSNGESKSQALRNAKLSYLKNADENLNHPFYWAGFVLQGDTGPLLYNNGFKGWYFLLIPIFFLFGYWVHRRTNFNAAH